MEKRHGGNWNAVPTPDLDNHKPPEWLVKDDEQEKLIQLIESRRRGGRVVVAEAVILGISACCGVGFAVNWALENKDKMNQMIQNLLR